MLHWLELLVEVNGKIVLDKNSQINFWMKFFCTDRKILTNKIFSLDNQTSPRSWLCVLHCLPSCPYWFPGSVRPFAFHLFSTATWSLRSLGHPLSYIRIFGSCIPKSRSSKTVRLCPRVGLQMGPTTNTGVLSVWSHLRSCLDRIRIPLWFGSFGGRVFGWIVSFWTWIQALVSLKRICRTGCLFGCRFVPQGCDTDCR